MPWIIIATIHIEEASQTKLLERVRAWAETRGNPDPVEPAISSVVGEVRGCVGFKTPALVDSRSGSIPGSLRALCVAKIIRSIKAVVDIPLSDQERDEERSYQRRLEMIKDGNWPIETPDYPASSPAQTSGAGVSLTNASGRITTRQSLTGI